MEYRIGNIGDDPRFYNYGAHEHYLGWSSSSKGASPTDFNFSERLAQSGSGAGFVAHWSKSEASLR